MVEFYMVRRSLLVAVYVKTPMVLGSLGESSGNDQRLIPMPTCEWLLKWIVIVSPTTRHLVAFPKLCAGSCNRVGGGISPAVLPHHRTYGSVSGGSYEH
jgi:hypothetical protein